MAIVPPQGTSTTGHNGVQGNWAGEGGPGPQQVTVGPALLDYLFCDPMFQNMTAQQYTAGTAGTAQIYTEVAPEQPAAEEGS
ncbi:MAG: hypothetical protein ACLPKI_26250 [Streptosporangiaceae bacterium]